MGAEYNSVFLSFSYTLWKNYKATSRFKSPRCRPAYFAVNRAVCFP